MNNMQSDSIWAAAMKDMRQPGHAQQPSVLDILDHHMPPAHLHEIFAANAADIASAFGLAQILAHGLGAQLAESDHMERAAKARPCFWVRAAGRAQLPPLHAPGMADMGHDVGDYYQVHAPDALAALRAGADIARCGGVGMVVIEIAGHPKILDLTATRRLALAAEKNGTSVILLRVDARPMPSAAYSRWQTSAAPSRALPANAPGGPCFDMELLRHRKFMGGITARLEWDSAERKFRQMMMDKDSDKKTDSEKNSGRKIRANAGGDKTAFGHISALSARQSPHPVRQSAA